MGVDYGWRGFSFSGSVLGVSGLGFLVWGCLGRGGISFSVRFLGFRAYKCDRACLIDEVDIVSSSAVDV